MFSIVTLHGSPTYKIDIFDDSNGAPVAAIVNVVGYFIPSSANLYKPVNVTRIVNTRNGTGGHTGGIGTQRVVYSTGGMNLPAGTTAIAVDLVAASDKGFGLLTIGPNTATGLQTSTLDYNGLDRDNMAIVQLASDGTFAIAGSGATADAVVDLVGSVHDIGHVQVRCAARARSGG